MSSYELFEKANCENIRKLNEQYVAQNKQELICPPDVATKDVVDRETLMIKNPFGVNSSCIDRSYERNLDLDMCSGYNCDKASFYQQPDKKNTYHNYLVVNDKEDLACTMNHQYFNNMTKRSSETKQIVSPPLVIGKDEPIPLPMWYECPF